MCIRDRYISRLPMDNQRKFYYFLLLGRLHSHRQQHDEAMKEFHSALETGYNTSSALTLTIMELQALSQPVMQLILLEKLVEVSITNMIYGIVKLIFKKQRNHEPPVMLGNK